MKILLHNRFHNTEMTTKVEPYLEGDAKRGDYLSNLSYYAQEPGSEARKHLRRIERTLCVHKTNQCACSPMIDETVID